MPKFRDGFLSGWKVSFFVVGWLGDHLIGGGWGRSHKEVRRIAVSEYLSKLLEIDLIVSSDIDESKQIFNLLEFWQLFCCLCVEFLHHFMKLFKGKVSCSGVVPLSYRLFTFLNASLGEIM